MQGLNLLTGWNFQDIRPCSSEPQALSDANSHSTQSNEQTLKVSKHLWMELCEFLRFNQNLRNLFKMNIEVLNVSKDTLSRFKHVTPTLKHLIGRYGNQNCIRAISVLEDFTHYKKNQYKFMYEGLTLGRAIEVLVRESTYLYKSLAKNSTANKHFLRLVTTWIDYVFLIHPVPLDAQEELKYEIIVHIGIVNNVSLE
jgi:hypothetical protein